MALSSSLLLLACSRSYDGDEDIVDSMGEAAMDTGGSDDGTESGGSGGDMESGSGDTEETAEGPACGNGVIDEGEECDGEELDGQSCEGLEQRDFSGGTLACADDCTFDTTGCTEPVCGNEIIEGDEECDGLDFGGSNCQEFGFGLGQLTCNEDCTISVETCIAQGASCNNDNDCQGELSCVNEICYDGSTGDPCINDDDCQSDDCHDWGRKTCK